MGGCTKQLLLSYGGRSGLHRWWPEGPVQPQWVTPVHSNFTVRGSQPWVHCCLWRSSF
jgi:hypothetical protein